MKSHLNSAFTKQLSSRVKIMSYVSLLDLFEKRFLSVLFFFCHIHWFTKLIVISKKFRLKYLLRRFSALVVISIREGSSSTEVNEMCGIVHQMDLLDNSCFANAMHTPVHSSQFCDGELIFHVLAEDGNTISRAFF